jgi:hypothetical protein
LSGRHGVTRSAFQVGGRERQQNAAAGSSSPDGAVPALAFIGAAKLRDFAVLTKPSVMSVVVHRIGRT